MTRLRRRQDAPTPGDLRVGEYRQLSRGELHGDVGQAIGRLPCGHVSTTTRRSHAVDPSTGAAAPAVRCPACAWVDDVAFEDWVPEAAGTA